MPRTWPDGRSAAIVVALCASAHPVRALCSSQVKTIGADHPFTRLVPDLSNGGDPDDAFSRIPYECDSIQIFCACFMPVLIDITHL